MVRESEMFCILGAPDAEMRLIEWFLKKHKIPYAYAVDKDGNIVKHKNAYIATVGEPIISKQIWLIECDVDENDIWYETKIIIDHHNPRDFGYKIPC